jgi:hypothetical protein
MVATGVVISVDDLMRLKFHLLLVLSFRDVSTIPLQGKHGMRVQFGQPGETGNVLPCIHYIVRALDSSRPIEISPAAGTGMNVQDEKPEKELIGVVFVDVFLHLFCNLKDWSSLPFLSLKQLLEGLCVITKKHNFDGRGLKPLQQLLRRSVSRAIELLNEDINNELRQLLLSAVQSFITQWHGFMGSIL